MEDDMSELGVRRQTEESRDDLRGLTDHVVRDIWRDTVREDLVADVKRRYEAGQLDLSPENIARAMLAHA